MSLQINTLSTPALLAGLRQYFGGAHTYNAGDLAVACHLCREHVHDADVLAVKGEGVTWFVCQECAQEITEGMA